MDMQLLQAASRHKAEKPFWRIELCPPPEVCQDWTMAQWDMFCKDCVEVLDATHFKWEPGPYVFPLSDSILRSDCSSMMGFRRRISVYNVSLASGFLGQRALQISAFDS